MQVDNHLTFTHRSPAELLVAYPDFVPTHDVNSEFTTQLPRKIVIIRSLVALGITLLVRAVIKTPSFRRAVLAVGFVFIAKTVYSHLIAKDPLAQFFSRELPYMQEINLLQRPNESICDAVRRVRWEDIGHKVTRTRTLDGRMVIIAKGMKFPKAPLEITDKRLFVYIERFNLGDCPRSRKLTVEQQSQFATIDECIHAIFFPFRGNTFKTHFLNAFSAPLNQEQLARAKPKDLANPDFIRGAEEMNLQPSCEVFCAGSITGARAFEIFAQLEP
jgi:hypothetical protein